MKKCLVCKKQISEKELCQSCLKFLKWKYKKNFHRRLRQLMESRKRDRDFEAIKLRRAK